MIMMYCEGPVNRVTDHLCVFTLCACTVFVSVSVVANVLCNVLFCSVYYAVL